VREKRKTQTKNYHCTQVKIAQHEHFVLNEEDIPNEIYKEIKYLPFTPSLLNIRNDSYFGVVNAD